MPMLLLYELYCCASRCAVEVEWVIMIVMGWDQIFSLLSLILDLVPRTRKQKSLVPLPLPAVDAVAQSRPSFDRSTFSDLI
jgi:hypothetical protein